MEHDVYELLVGILNITKRNNEILEPLFAKLQEEVAEAKKEDEVVVDAKKK